jgi:peptidoglycan hydrolase-like protein with peptidoglycan-binding domain
MRALILAAIILGILTGANVARAGLSTAPREVASADTGNVTDEATQENEDQIGLTRTARREVQRRLAKLGFETSVNGKFDESTRVAITRWQEEHGYPKTGFLNIAQHTALLEESSAAIEAGQSDNQDHHRSGGRAHRPRGIGGPIGVIGGAIGGLFRR